MAKVKYRVREYTPTDGDEAAPRPAAARRHQAGSWRDDLRDVRCKMEDVRCKRADVTVGPL